MKLYVDRSLPVPLGVQLRGLIEFGIACGDLSAGERLPSVRELADTIGVAPMTVSQVYREMKAAGLIETRAGSGTYVADSSRPHSAGPTGAAEFHRRIDSLVEDAFAIGLRASDIVSLISSRVHARLARGRRARIVVVGTFQTATSRYARLIGDQLEAHAILDAVTVDALADDEACRNRTASADLVITFAYRQREVEELLPGTPVATVSFIPSEETRLALASLDPLARVCVVSRLPEFLPTLKHGVQRFAAHVAEVSACVLHSAETDRLVRSADVIVYATGSEPVLDRVEPDRPAIEYRHIPDPTEIERIIVPRVMALRSSSQILESQA
jgi:DNA-binding transcriptional regulator YhcF (GntR family)